MAVGSLNLRVSKSDFEQRINDIQLKMDALSDVVNRYENAKSNLDQFIEGNDSNYEAMVERINKNIIAAKKAYAALNEAKTSLQQTVNQMQDMSGNVDSVIDAATEAASSAINAAIKIDAVL